jgi:hypothetical protein
LIVMAGLGWPADGAIALRTAPPPTVAIQHNAPADRHEASRLPQPPATVREWVIPPGRPSVAVPILMYHHVRVNPNPRDALGFDLSVTPSDFRAQMDYLASAGYHPVDLSDLRAYYEHARS